MFDNPGILDWYNVDGDGAETKYNAAQYTQDIF